MRDTYKTPPQSGPYHNDEDLRKKILTCCDDETRDDIISNFAEMFNMPELLELDQ